MYLLKSWYRAAVHRPQELPAAPRNPHESPGGAGIALAKNTESQQIYVLIICVPSMHHLCSIYVSFTCHLRTIYASSVYHLRIAYVSSMCHLCIIYVARILAFLSIGGRVP